MYVITLCIHVNSLPYVPKNSYIYVEEYINYYSLHDLFPLNRGGGQKSFHALCTQTSNPPPPPPPIYNPGYPNNISSKVKREIAVSGFHF